MKGIWIALALVFAVLVSCSGDRAAASSDSLVCPKAIPVQQTLPATEPGWGTFEDDTPAQLMNVALFEGHPKGKASLVPDEEAEADGRAVSRWHLLENGTRRYWIACYYDHSRIGLTRQVPSGAKVCEVTRDLNMSVGGMPVVLGLTCK